MTTKTKTKTGNPILDSDFGNVLGFAKLAEQFKLPGVDSAVLMESQRRNFEAVTKANQVAFEGVQAIMGRQAEILRQILEGTTKAVGELAKPGKPEDKWVAQTDLIKEAYELSLSNLHELTDMSVKSNSEAAAVISHRFTDGLDELKGALKAAGGTAT